MQVPRFSRRISLIEMAPRAAPHSGCPGRPALPCPVCHQLHKERAVIGRIFQALPNFCPHRQTPCLLLYIILNNSCTVSLNISKPPWWCSTTHHQGPSSGAKSPIGYALISEISPLETKHSKQSRDVSHCGLAIYIKPYLKAKE
jgi:hypothetical protein